MERRPPEGRPSRRRSSGSSRGPLPGLLLVLCLTCLAGHAHAAGAAAGNGVSQPSSKATRKHGPADPAPAAATPGQGGSAAVEQTIGKGEGGGGVPATSPHHHHQQHHSSAVSQLSDSVVLRGTPVLQDLHAPAPLEGGASGQQGSTTRDTATGGSSGRDGNSNSIGNNLTGVSRHSSRSLLGSNSWYYYCLSAEGSICDPCNLYPDYPCLVGACVGWGWGWGSGPTAPGYSHALRVSREVGERMHAQGGQT